MFVLGCSKKESSEPVSNNMADISASASNLDLQVLQKIESIENIESFDNETIKALSVVVRTNIINSENYKNQTTFEYNPKSERIHSLVSSTSNEVLFNNESKIDTIYIDNNNDNKTWVQEIKKVDILKYMKDNNISLSNISEIETETTEEGFVKNIVIGGKNIDIKKLMKYFQLKSNKITNIKNKKTSFIVEGVGEGNEFNFNINETQKLAKEGQNYKKILKNRYNSFQIIINGEK